jgi:hypothetical protein
MIIHEEADIIPKHHSHTMDTHLSDWHTEWLQVSSFSWESKRCRDASLYRSYCGLA